VLPGKSILGVRTTRRHHLVECSNAVTLLEFYDILADLMDNSRDVIALIGVVELRKPS